MNKPSNNWSWITFGLSIGGIITTITSYNVIITTSGCVSGIGWGCFNQDLNALAVALVIGSVLEATAFVTSFVARRKGQSHTTGVAILPAIWTFVLLILAINYVFMNLVSRSNCPKTYYDPRLCSHGTQQAYPPETK